MALYRELGYGSLIEHLLRNSREGLGAWGSNGVLLTMHIATPSAEVQEAQRGCLGESQDCLACSPFMVTTSTMDAFSRIAPALSPLSHEVCSFPHYSRI